MIGSGRFVAGRETLLSLLTGLMVTCSVADAQTPLPADPDLGEFPSLSAWQWGLRVGYGHGVDLSSDATFLGDVRFVAISPRIGWGFTDELFSNRRTRGRFEFVAEGTFLSSLEPRSGFGGGLVTNVRYVFTGAGRLMPFFGAGAGPIFLEFNNDDNQSDGISFVLQVGGGAEYFLTPSLSVSGHVRLHHISNAGLHTPNPGINDVLFLFGVSHHVF